MIVPVTPEALAARARAHLDQARCHVEVCGELTIGAWVELLAMQACCAAFFGQFTEDDLRDYARDVVLAR